MCWKMFTSWLLRRKKIKSLGIQRLPVLGMRLPASLISSCQCDVTEHTVERRWAAAEPEVVFPPNKYNRCENKVQKDH